MPKMFKGIGSRRESTAMMSGLRNKKGCLNPIMGNPEASMMRFRATDEYNKSFDRVPKNSRRG